MESYKPRYLYIEEFVLDHPFTKKIISQLQGIPAEIIKDHKTLGEHKLFTQRIAEDKNNLALARKKGAMLKNIGRMSQSQYYLFHEIDCRYDCQYCYLQYYFQTKTPTIYVNREELFNEIEKALLTEPNPYFHAGEVCDSLAFDNLTDFSREIAQIFVKHPNGTIEFRTKSTNVENLLSLDRVPQNLIPAWTLNPQFVIERVEHKTPSLDARLTAAKKCQEAGYTVGVRLDPVLKFEGWEAHYKEMIEEIFCRLDPKKIDYISLGALKLHKNLSEIILKRFPYSMVLKQEFVPSTDGKLRPLKFDRVDMYKKMVEWISKLSPKTDIKLSMETEEVKKLVFS